ncbi:MAG: hypothetical protein FWH18_10835 [Marinilabiliaceae bacterium]|nr:hypothetical protein [Marinilabiliaceae bacterium]
MIDINYDFFRDGTSGDLDATSPTLRKYHKTLWSKALPNGNFFDLSNTKKGVYLYHKSELGEFFLGSDIITQSYIYRKSNLWLIEKIPDKLLYEIDNKGYTIGQSIIFPNNKIDGKMTINGMRGCNSKIDDRFDLTLECIRRFYLGETSPLYDTFLRYKNFFELFDNFSGYVKFFLLDDLVDENRNIKFFLPFDNFKSSPKFSDVEVYLLYIKRVLDFINQRSKRIEKYTQTTINE